MDDGGLKHRSVSQLNTYNNCSELYRLRYIDKPDAPPAPAAWLAQGTAYHEAVRFYEESGRSPMVDMRRTYQVYYDAEIEKMKVLQPDMSLWLKAPSKKIEQDIFERRERGADMAVDYTVFAGMNDFDIKDIDDFTLAVEVPFELNLGQTLVKGSIDQILQLPRGVEVRDLKTGNRESASIQLGVYKVAVEKIFGWPVDRASFFYAKDSKLVTLSRADLDKYSEEYVGELFHALDVGVTNRVFIPNPGSQCTLCPVRKFCREMGLNVRK